MGDNDGCEEWRAEVLQRLSKLEARMDLGPWLIGIAITLAAAIAGAVVWITNLADKK